MGKHLLAKSHFAKMNKLTQLDVTELTSSMVNEIDLDIWRRQGSRAIIIASSQCKFILDIHV